MKVKVNEASGPVLDWMVCEAKGHFVIGQPDDVPYVGMPQAHCWRCGTCGPSSGAGYKEQHRIEPLGNWFD